MDNIEKVNWIITLWGLSLGATWWLVGSICTGWTSSIAWSPIIMFAIMFVIALTAWLFRVTYVSGRNS